MSCPHATTTTMLWLYGEGEESHAEHVAGCEACQEVAREHADVMSAMSGVSHLDLQVTQASSRPANRVWPIGIGGAAVLAAAAALATITAPDPAPEVVAEVGEPVDLSVFAALDDDPLDDRFDALTLELGDLAANVEGETL